MLRRLLAARWRHYVNFIRYHFDRRTVVILGAIGAWLAYQAWRSVAGPADSGISFDAFARPGFGARWITVVALGLPVLFGILFLLARGSGRRTAELDLVRTLPVPDSTLKLWLLVRHLSKTGPLLVLVALPALGGDAGHPGAAGILRAGGVLVAGLALDYLALTVARRPRPARRTSAATAATHHSRPVREISMRGGPVSVLIRRDLSYLLRRSRSVLVVVMLAVIAEAWILLAGPNLTHALIAAAAVQVIHAGIQLGSLDVLFRRDEPAAALLKILPLGGARLWRARALFAAMVLALPGVLPLVIAPARGAAPLAWGAFLAGAVIAVPVCGALLYADVHVALFPRTRVASFLLVTALLFIVLLWFFVPIATPLLLIFLLVHWGLRASRAFDRVEFE